MATLTASAAGAAAEGAAAEGAAAEGAAAEGAAAGSSVVAVVEAQPASTRLRLAATATSPKALVLFICTPQIDGQINRLDGYERLLFIPLF